MHWCDLRAARGQTRSSWDREADLNFRKKLARGKFTAVYSLQCLVATGQIDVRLPLRVP